MNASLTAGRRRSTPAFVLGGCVGVLGGLIGLGGAEFRLPLLIGVFGFAALHAVVLNKTMSLLVVLCALPARLGAVPLDRLVRYGGVLDDLLLGSLVGAWLGASWATRMRALHRVLALLLALIAVVLALTHALELGPLPLSASVRTLAGVAAGLGIGVVAALMGVAGGELLIPTIVLLHGVDIKLAGSLSLAVSLPTMLVAFARYSRDDSFRVVRENRRFVLAMAAGSVLGTVVGGLLLGVVPAAVLVPLLVVLLTASAVKVWRHA